MDLPVQLLRSVQQLTNEALEAWPPALRPLTRLCVLSEVYQAEEKNRSVDPALLAGEESSRCFGTCHTTLPLNHRQNILQWMCNASLRVGWSYATVHTAISVFDSYALNFHTARAIVEETPQATSDTSSVGGLKKILIQYKAPALKTCIAREDLPSLSASCLYIAACLRESAIDQTIISVEEFQKICPEIGSAYVVRTQQTELLGLLKQTGTLGNRTPYDLAQLFISRMAMFRQTQLIYRVLLATNSINLCIETIMHVSIACYLNTISLCLPASSWVASTLMHLCQQLIPAVIGCECSLASQSEMLTCLAEEVMCYPGGSRALRMILKIYRPIIRGVFSILNQHYENSELRKSRELSRTGRQIATRSVMPPRPHIFKIPSNLSRASLCSYKSPLVFQFRLSILPTLREIGAHLAADLAASRRSLSSTTSERPLLEGAAPPLVDQGALIEQENSPAVKQGGRLLMTKPLPRLQHVRRHTSVCKCALCAHYQENPPDWYAFRAQTRKPPPPLSVISGNF